MLFYITLFILVIFIAWLADNSEYSYLCIGINALILIVFLGLRDYGVGTDTLIYPEHYFTQASRFNIIELATSDETFDLGYLVLAYIANLISDNPQSMLFITEAFIVITTTIGIVRLKNILGFDYFIYYLFYCLVFLNPSLNYMRQNCAVSLLLVGFSYMIEHKWRQYSIFQIASFFFHSSSVLFLIVPFFLIVYERATLKWRYIIIGTFFAGIIVALISFYQYLEILSQVGVVSETYGERYGEAGEYSSENLYGVSYLTYIFLNYLLLTYSYENDILPKNHQFLALCLYTSSVLFFYTSTYVAFLSRLSIYFDYIVIVFVVVFVNSKLIPIYIRLAIVLVQCYMWIRLYVIAESSETIPYSSEILGI